MNYGLPLIYTHYEAEDALVRSASLDFYPTTTTESDDN